MKYNAFAYKKDNRGGEHPKQKEEKEKVNWAKKPLNDVEYIDLMRRTIVNDVINHDNHYRSFTQLIRGMKNNLATNPDKRLPEEKTQRNLARTYVFGKPVGNDEDLKYPNLVQKCMKDYSRERLIELMRNEKFTYDMSFYDRTESPTKSVHPNLIFFTPEDKENELSDHFKLFFTDIIKGLIIGYKCLMIYFDDYDNLDAFVKTIEEFMGDRDILINGQKKENSDSNNEAENEQTVPNSNQDQFGQDEGKKKAEENG